MASRLVGAGPPNQHTRRTGRRRLRSPPASPLIPFLFVLSLLSALAL